jgi:hypothetical protein
MDTIKNLTKDVKLLKMEYKHTSDARVEQTLLSLVRKQDKLIELLVRKAKQFDELLSEVA